MLRLACMNNLFKVIFLRRPNICFFVFLSEILFYEFAKQKKYFFWPTKPLFFLAKCQLRALRLAGQKADVWKDASSIFDNFLKIKSDILFQPEIPICLESMGFQTQKLSENRLLKTKKKILIKMSFF